MGADRFAHLQHEAVLSLALLDSGSDGGGGFDAVFMKPVPFMLKFDALCQ